MAIIGLELVIVSLKIAGGFMTDNVLDPLMELCKICSKHGRIRMSDGICCVEFASNSSGQVCVENMVAAESLTSVQARALLYKIRSLDLPITDEQVDPKLLHMIGIWNGACWPDARYNGEPDAIHKAAEEFERLAPAIDVALEELKGDEVLIIDFGPLEAKKPH